jgi:uncharacterized protein (DUF1015 family)
VAEIRPFCGWHYQGEVSNFIAPPYDILSAKDKADLLAKSEDNIVSVDLPVAPAKEVGPDRAYQRAAKKLAAMKSAGPLVQDEKLTLYAYSQTFTWAGKSHTRKAMLCGVRATELYGDIWPHEKTFAGPKADRLKLTEVTRTQLSPIFGFYEDTREAVRTLWSGIGDTPPLCHAVLDGVQEKLWAVDDHDVIDRVRRAMRETKVFIADGHHRYTTALNYRNTLFEAGKIDEAHEANYVLFALVAMNDPGLLVLPTHRLINGIADGFDSRQLARETQQVVQWRDAPVNDTLLDDPDAFLRPFGPGSMAFLDLSDLRTAHIARLKNRAIMDKLAAQEHPIWRTLDVAVLHRFFLEQYLAGHLSEGAEPGYTAFGRKAMEAMKDGACQMAVLLQCTPLPAVRDIALAKMVMPHKSTYFYPKLATGMVMKPLT